MADQQGQQRVPPNPTRKSKVAVRAGSARKGQDHILADPAVVSQRSSPDQIAAAAKGIGRSAQRKAVELPEHQGARLHEQTKQRHQVRGAVCTPSVRRFGVQDGRSRHRIAGVLTKKIQCKGKRAQGSSEPGKDGAKQQTTQPPRTDKQARQNMPIIHSWLL